MLLSSKAVRKSIDKGTPAEIRVQVKNTDRTFGTLLGAEITRHHPEGLEEDTITVRCEGRDQAALDFIMADVKGRCKAEGLPDFAWTF